MNTVKKVQEALNAWKDGEYKFTVGDFEGSIRSYENALNLSRALPVDEPFDHPCFAASCYSGLSGALGRLGRYHESLSAAEAALSFFNQYGEMYPAETGKWIMSVVNRGSALAMFGRPNEALEAFQLAKRMLADRGMDGADNRQWLDMVDQNILTVQTILSKRKSKS